LSKEHWQHQQIYFDINMLFKAALIAAPFVAHFVAATGFKFYLQQKKVNQLQLTSFGLDALGMVVSSQL
jgi:hypothetical protein